MSTTDQDLLRSLRQHSLYLLGRWLHWSRAQHWLREDTSHGLGVFAEEVESLLGRVEPRAPDLAQIPPTPAESWQLVETCFASSATPLALRWRALSESLSLSSEERRLLALLVTISTDHTIARAMRFAWADFGRVSLPLGFALRLLQGNDTLEFQPALLQESALIHARSPLFQRALVKRHREQADSPLTELGLSLHDEAARFLIGCPRPDDLPSAPPPLPARLAPLAARAARRLQDHPCEEIALYGPEGSGRKALAVKLFADQKRATETILFDLGQAYEEGRVAERLEAAIRRATLWQRTILIEGGNRIPSPQQPRWLGQVQRTLLPLKDLHRAWILEEFPDNLQISPQGKIPVPYPTRQERAITWGALLSDDLNAREALGLAGRFLITEGQIATTIREARSLVALEEGDLLDTLETIARREAAVGLGRLATPETKHVTLDQLIVDDETRTLIHEIISYTANRSRLAGDWGFERMLPYGLGVTALFAGPPGTGKTLAANAIASALGLELFRVDLSQLVSKYIGETEKHLSTLFSAAENGEVMLLFDEADSLFSKRTEVKSSVDRYANLEVNYLLQRIERFDGVVILTTNFEAGIDDAFARRIRFRVRFPEPDKESRKRLWQVLTPESVPLADDVDFDAMAEDYELSGGHIKEVVLRAAALAMGETPISRVTQDLLIRSAEAEYRKLGKLVLVYDS